MAGYALVKNRDNHVCIVSHLPDPAAAHIFPKATAEQPGRLRILANVLNYFWGPQRPRPWILKFTDPNFVTSPANMISLNHHLHFWFDNADIAFKPFLQQSKKSESHFILIE